MFQKARGIVFWILCTALLSLSGCAPKCSVSVNSLVAVDVEQKKSYIILSGNDDVPSSDLQFSEFSLYTDTALQSLGFSKAKNVEEANAAIILGYGMESQAYQYTCALPIWGQNGISSSQSTGSINTFGNSATYSCQTSYTPSYGVVSSMPCTGTKVLSSGYITLSCFDIVKYKKTRNAEDARPLWFTTAASAGQNGDMRIMFPIMLTAMLPHIATNTGKAITVDLPENDDYAQKIKNCASAPY